MRALLAENCHFESNGGANTLAAFLIAGLLLAYVSQHIRIVRASTSIGFSPWFLLLGSTSSASALLNIITLQWPMLRCCADVSVGKCIEITSGVLQVGMQWLLFTIILVLFMMYYPQDLKYSQPTLVVPVSDTDASFFRVTKLRSCSREWRLSILISWAVSLHLAFIILTTMFLLATSPSLHTRGLGIERWATFLGVSSGLLATIQYTPQLLRTYRLRFVGALSISMMAIKCPGAVALSVSIAMRPGTDWRSWLMYAVAGLLQTALLLMCIVWKIRQRRHRIDDFGRPLVGPLPGDTNTNSGRSQREVEVGPRDSDATENMNDGEDLAREDTPLLNPLGTGTRKVGCSSG